MAEEVFSSFHPKFYCIKTSYVGLLLTFCVFHCVVFTTVYSVYDCNKNGCENGQCVNNTCKCDGGWSGKSCEKCHGRASVLSDSGLIMDGVGNYSLDTKCSWLIKTGQPNMTLRLKFNQFATECGWDHLYIHDGDSAFSPLLAAYSGLLISEDKVGVDVDFFATIHQPYIYVHFYSDAAYTMSGFNISFSIGDCPLGCSEHGTCESGKCFCHSNWTGSGCETEVCPDSCNGGSCDTATGKCVCPDGKRGPDCSLSGGVGVWEIIQTDSPPAGRASHATVVNGNTMWLLGGFSLSLYSYHDLYRYQMDTQVWTQEMPSGEVPIQRYGHAVVYHENKLYMFGGVVDGNPTNETWMYNIPAKTWRRLAASSIQVRGHSAHYYDGNIHVIFGYSPVFGYLNIVQLYNIANDSWSVAETTGATVHGGYGHSSVFDDQRNLVYVFGGYHSGSQSSYNLTDVLYSYSPRLVKWTILRSSGSPRYLHGAVILGDVMLVFGGNTHNDTSVSFGAKCYSTDFLAYDIKCNSWQFLPPPGLVKDLSRYGHSMVKFNNEVVMFGGFHGVMLNDVVRYIPGNCSYLANKSLCESNLPGVKCVWSGASCKERDSSYIESCDPSLGSDIYCSRFSTCPSCHSNPFNCHWCHDKCSNKSCVLKSGMFTNCTDLGCELLHSCQACISARCIWDRTSCNYPTQIMPANLGQIEGTSPAVYSARCEAPCSVYASCENCTRKNCMWCSNMQQCVETNSYVASYPYGQCTEWTTKEVKCPATRCSGLYSCKACQAHPMCGWCNDAGDTGLGKCIEGANQGPVTRNGTKHFVDMAKCPAERWFFLKCPLCQCNGHSVCLNGTSICQDCKHLTEGHNCEFCQDGYYGNPRNGGNCSACACNGQADTCDRESGGCFCKTRGVTGHKCDKCDDIHKYYGDPKSGGTCYYQLVTDYQFTFNLSKTEDKFYTRINFMNVPKSGDRDVDFTLNCSGAALLNITFKSKSHPQERFVVQSDACDYFRSKFEHKDYAFAGEQNTTFLVYVYEFQTPFWLQISFSQFPKIDLVHFFVTFFSCFLSLLLIAAALWKIKHKYDSYRRRQLMLVEMQQMASRPFSAVCVEIDNKLDKPAADKKDQKDLPVIRRRKNMYNKPGAICLEPLHGNKAAILTLLIQLPTGEGPFAPNGQSGIALGSSMVTFGGNTRKQSIEHVKGEKSRLRKHLPAVIQHTPADHTSV